MKKIILILTFLFFLLELQGCGKEKYDEMAYYTTYEREEVDLSSIAMEELIWDIECCRDTAVFATFVRNDDLTEGKRRLHLYEMELETKAIREIEFELESATEMVRDITIDTQGNIYMLSQEPNGEEAFLNKIHTTQGLLERKVIAKEILSHFENSNIVLQVDTDGYVYLAGTEALFVLDNQGEVYYSMTEDVLVFDAIKMKDGRLLIGGASSELDGFYQFNIENKKWEEYTLLETYLKDNEGGYAELFLGDEEFDFYNNDSSDMFSENFVWGIKDKHAYKLFNFEESNVLADKITHISAIGECSFLCIENADTTDADINERYNKLVILKPAVAEESKTSDDKTRLRMVGYNISAQMKEAVFYFNQDNDKYHIDIKDYAVENGEEEDALKKLNLELLQPGACDLVALNRLPKEEYIEKEMLTDLAPLLESGSVMNKDSFLDCIMNVLTDEQGAIYYMIPEFSIQTIVQKGQSGQGQEDDYFVGLEEKTTNLEAGQQLFYYSDKALLLEKLICYNPNSLVDEKKKKCSFDSDEFCRILYLVNSINTMEIDSRVSEPESIRTGQVQILDWDLEYFFDIMLLDNLFNQNADFIGYATENGNKQIIDGHGLEIGILNSSDKKQGAWEFFEYVFAKENYDKLFGITKFPVRKESLADKIEYLSATEDYVKEDGTVVDAEEIVVGFEDYEIKPGPLTDRQVQIFESLCNNSVYAKTIDEKYMEIILEETESYFNGQKSEDEVVNNLQNRIGNALKE